MLRLRCLLLGTALALASAFPQNDLDCEDNQKNATAQFKKSCSQLKSRCTSYEFKSSWTPCEGYVWQFCPKTCRSCMMAYDNGPTCKAVETQELDPEAQAFVSLIVFLIYVVCPLAWCIGVCCAFCKAHQARSEILQKARSGQPVEPPRGGCMMCCCGPAVVYYWEGVSAMCLIGFFICWCIPCCCWQPSLRPKENGVEVGPVTTTGYQGAIGTSCPQPQPVGGNPIVTAQVVTVVGAPVAATPAAVPVVVAAAPAGTRGENPETM